MAILSSQADTYGEVSRVLIAWVVNFIASLAGLFISLYLLISHDDLNSNFITPIELSNNLNSVSLYSKVIVSLVHPDRLRMFPCVPVLLGVLRPMVPGAPERPPVLI